MDPTSQNTLKSYLESLEEDDLWYLLVEFFTFMGIKADVVHSTGEHGIDVIAFISQYDDLMGKGHNILIQAKKGKLTLDKWRKQILYQILEMPYYRIPHRDYIDHLARRVLLVVSGEVTLETRNSIDEFNKKHDVTIEYWGENDLIRVFDRSGFADKKLEQITGVGKPDVDKFSPPIVGQE